VQRAAWQCAVAAGELEAAAHWAQSLGPAGQLEQPRTLYNHALLLQQSGAPAAARALVAPLLEAELDDPGVRPAALQLAASLAVAEGDLDGALRLARAREAPPPTRAWVAARLLKAGRPAEARPLLLSACPALEGEAGEACRSNLALTAAP
jgi:predicted Zn-dependent protease